MTGRAKAGSVSKDVGVLLNPTTQYADDANLRARQRLWQHQDPYFDLVAWTLGLAEVGPGQAVLDVGCGNGMYLSRLHEQGVDAIGCDLSIGMLHGATGGILVNADVTALPLADQSFDVVLAPHMLYHVTDRTAAALEVRRVLRPDGVCVAITNGDEHMRSMRDLVESAVREATPGWEMRNPATHVFSLENGAAQLAMAFDSVELIRPSDIGPVPIRDVELITDYVGSIADHYQAETTRPWAEVLAYVGEHVQRRIDADGVFIVRSDPGAFVCR